jgi:hypothetical protein
VGCCGIDECWEYYCMTTMTQLFCRKRVLGKMRVFNQYFDALCVDNISGFANG